MLTSKQILDLIPPMPPAGIAGATEAMRRHNRKTGATGGALTDLTRNQQQFLHDLEAQPRLRGKPYAHPGAAAALTIRGNGPLTPSELAWLDRLPRDPAQVSFQDAKTLAGLVMALASTSTSTWNPNSRLGASDAAPDAPKATAGDLRLVRAVYDPIREMHDRAKAETDLGNAALGYPPIPQSALGALSDAIHGENDGALEPDEATARAEKLLQQARLERAQHHDRQRFAAEDQLAAVKKAARDRTAVTV